MLLKRSLERAVEPRFDVVNGFAGFMLQAAKPLILFAFVVGQVVVGEVAPFLLGLTLELVLVAACAQFSLIVDVIVVNVHG